MTPGSFDSYLQRLARPLLKDCSRWSCDSTTTLFVRLKNTQNRPRTMLNLVRRPSRPPRIPLSYDRDAPATELAPARSIEYGPFHTWVAPKHAAKPSTPRLTNDATLFTRSMGLDGMHCALRLNTRRANIAPLLVNRRQKSALNDRYECSRAFRIEYAVCFWPY